MTKALPAFFVMTTGLLVGCDLSGEYEKRYQQALVTAGHRARFDELLYAAPEEIKDTSGQGTGVRLRIPKLFDQQSRSLRAADPAAQPPFVQLPGLNYARESRRHGAYAYFAAIPKADQKVEAVQAALAQQIAASFPGANWSDTQLSTPQGQTVSLKRLRAEGPQEFMDAKTKAPTRQPGRFDLYLIESPSHYVLIGWRGPSQSPLAEASEAAMGSVTVEG